MTTTEAAVRLRGEEIDEAGAVLSRAFDDDPLMSWWEPDLAKQRRWSPWFFTAACRTGHLYGTIHTTPGTIEGAAIWLSSGQTGTHVNRIVRSGMVLMPFKMGIGPFRRVMTTLAILEKLHKQNVPPEHWYLMVLGVEPARQGHGIGSALMQPILAKADGDHVPCYLETQKARNVPLYQRHGFVVLKELDLPDGGPHIWTMRRDAR